MSSQLDGVRRFVGQRKAPPELPRRDTQVVVVAGGKGGTGTSTVAALLALLAADAGLEVLLVDGVDGLGGQHQLFGLRPEHSLAALRGGAVAPADLLLDAGPDLRLLPGGGEAELASPLAPAERRALFRRVAPLFTDYGLVVVDAGSRLDALTAACSEAPARLLAVTAADRIAMAATHALIKVAAQRYADLAVDVLVNRSDEQGALAVFGQLRLAAEQFLDRVPGYAGALPDDACLAAGVAAGMSIAEAATGSPAATAMHDVAARLIQQLRAQTR